MAAAIWMTTSACSLEHELGGNLLERSSTGVRPTVGGHALAAKVRALLGNYDSAMLEVRRLVRGHPLGWMSTAANRRDFGSGVSGSQFSAKFETSLGELHLPQPYSQPRARQRNERKLIF